MCLAELDSWACWTRPTMKLTVNKHYNALSVDSGSCPTSLQLYKQQLSTHIWFSGPFNEFLARLTPPTKVLENKKKIYRIPPNAKRVEFNFRPCGPKHNLMKKKDKFSKMCGRWSIFYWNYLLKFSRI